MCMYNDVKLLEDALQLLQEQNSYTPTPIMKVLHIFKPSVKGQSYIFRNNKKSEDLQHLEHSKIS